MTGRYDPPTPSVAPCRECGGMGQRGGNTAFACACLAKKVKAQGEQIAALEARLKDIEGRRGHDTEAV